MAPIATQTMVETTPASLKLRQTTPQPQDPEAVARNQLPGPLKNLGLIERYPHFEVTPAIGREFKGDIQLDELMNAPNKEELIKDLAYMISRRGVCFFRDQNISSDDMMKLAEAVGVASGRPSGSKMCIHPVSENTPEIGTKTMEISASRQNKGGGIRRIHDDLSRWASVAWHSDVSFENVPADYSMLKINVLPESGGDTMWASTSDVLDKMSPSFRDYLETLTATHDASFFHAEAAQHGIKIDKERQRGNPLNNGDHLTASHPLIRTNPVTGWKAMYVNKGFYGRIDGVSRDESDIIAKYCFDLINNNMDIQCRFRWEKGSVAIWDNRCTWHSALFDYNEERAGDRASSIGEKPYLDPSSQYKSQALKAEGKKW